MTTSTPFGSFNYSDYVYEKFLGMGGNGSVAIYRNSINGHQIAVKQTELGSGSRMESHILKSLKNSKRIIQYLHHRETGLNLLIYMELADGDLHHYIRENGPIGNSLKFWQMAYQMAEGIFKIHKSGYMHRDLKPSNVLVVNGNQIKIADFGSSAEIAKKPTSRLLGTIKAPEMILGQPYNEKIDIWCLGCIYYYITTGKYPFNSDQTYLTNIGERIGYTSKYLELVKNRIWLEKSDYPIKPALPAMKTTLGRTNTRAINSCLQSDPSLRINADELLQLLDKFVLKVKL